jgi:hypothetical protein
MLLETLLRIRKREQRVLRRVNKERAAKLAALRVLIVKRASRTRLFKIADNLPKALSPLLERIGLDPNRVFEGLLSVDCLREVRLDRPTER